MFARTRRSMSKEDAEKVIAAGLVARQAQRVRAARRGEGAAEELEEEQEESGVEENATGAVSDGEDEEEGEDEQCGESGDRSASIKSIDTDADADGTDDIGDEQRTVSSDEDAAEEAADSQDEDERETDTAARSMTAQDAQATIAQGLVAKRAQSVAVASPASANADKAADITSTSNNNSESDDMQERNSMSADDARTTITQGLVAKRAQNVLGRESSIDEDEKEADDQEHADDSDVDGDNDNSRRSAGQRKVEGHVRSDQHPSDFSAADAERTIRGGMVARRAAFLAAGAGGEDGDDREAADGEPGRDYNSEDAPAFSAEDAQRVVAAGMVAKRAEAHEKIVDDHFDPSQLSVSDEEEEDSDSDSDYSRRSVSEDQLSDDDDDDDDDDNDADKPRHSSANTSEHDEEEEEEDIASPLEAVEDNDLAPPAFIIQERELSPLPPRLPPRPRVFTVQPARVSEDTQLLMQRRIDLGKAAHLRDHDLRVHICSTNTSLPHNDTLPTEWAWQRASVLVSGGSCGYSSLSQRRRRYSVQFGSKPANWASARAPKKTALWASPSSFSRCTPCPRSRACTWAAAARDSSSCWAPCCSKPS